MFRSPREVVDVVGAAVGAAERGGKVSEFVGVNEPATGAVGVG